MPFVSLEQQIKDKAREIGFDAAGITDASPLGPEHAAHLQAWLQAGCAGPLDYMHRNLDVRIDPARLLPDARSVVVVALNYKPRPEDAPPPADAAGRVALYAHYEDYHPFMRSLLAELAAFISARAGREHRLRICVDSAPLAEKALAVRAGLGFVGKNHLLIHPQLGPQILLGEIVTTLPLDRDEPAGGACLGCNRCVEACPTGALRPDGLLDARRCISCLTQYGPADGDVDLAGWLFGCDQCLLACPFHHEAPARANRRFRCYPDRAGLSPRELLAMDAATFDARFHDSPIKKPGLDRLRRNARLALRPL